MARMPVTIDGQSVETAGNPRDLRSLLADITARIEPQGRMIVEVSIDGQPVAGKSLEERQASDVSGAQVSLTTAHRGQFVAATLEEVRAALSATRLTHAQAADMLRKDDMTSAMQHVSRLVEVWQQTQTAVLQSVQLLRLEPAKLLSEGRSLEAHAAALLEQLKSMRTALQGRDTLGLADALAYEWPLTITRWDQLIEVIIHAAQE